MEFTTVIILAFFLTFIEIFFAAAFASDFSISPFIVFTNLFTIARICITSAAGLSAITDYVNGCAI